MKQFENDNMNLGGTLNSNIEFLMKKKYVFYEAFFYRCALVQMLFIVLSMILFMIAYFGLPRESTGQVILSIIAIVWIGSTIVLPTTFWLITKIKQSNIKLTYSWKQEAKRIVFQIAFKRKLWKLSSVVAHCKSQKIMN